MWRAGWIGASALACAGCERAEPTAKQSALDPCALVTQSDATALFGNPAVKNQLSSPGVCAWGIDYPDHSSSLLQLAVQGNGFPVILVTRTEITIEGKPYTPEPPTVEQLPIGQNGFIETSRAVVRVHWSHGGMLVDLTLLSAGPSTFTAVSKRDQLKGLARKVDAAL